MKLNELDLAQLKFECRQMYKNIGDKGCLQVIYESLIFINIVFDVMEEERKNEKKI